MTKCALFLPAFLMVTFTFGTVLTAFSQKERRKPAPASTASTRLSEAEFTDGERYFILEDYAKALYYFQRALELNPNNAAIHYKMAEVLAKSTKEEDLRKAAVSIENALRLDKTNRYFYQLAANVYASLSNFPKAEQTVISMMQEISGSEEYLYELAAYYQYDHKPQDAISTYNKAESILGVNEVSSLQKQRLYLEQGRTDKAMEEGEKLIRAFPDEPRFVTGLAEMLSQFKQGPKAIVYLENYLKNHPGAGSVKMLLAGLYRENGQEQKCRELSLDALKDPTLDVGSKVMMVGTYTAMLSQMEARKLDDPDLKAFALSLLEKLEAEYPNDPNVHMAGGDLNLTLKRIENAQQEYSAAIHSGSTSFEVWERLLYLETQSNELDSLLVHSEQAMELFPNQARFFYLNGYAHLRKKHFREAITALEQAKKLSTSIPELSSEVSSMLGDAYHGTKAYAKSDQAYEDALAINPEYDIVLNNYSYYLALRKENLEKAEKMSTLLVRKNPEDAAFLDTHAWVLYTRGKYKEARKVMEKAIGTGSVGAVHFEHYGDILYQLGDVDKAVTQWQKAKAMDNGNTLIDKKIANRKP